MNIRPLNPNAFRLPMTSVAAQRTAPSPTIEKARDLFESVDLASMFGHAVAEVRGTPTFHQTTVPDIVRVNGTLAYDDLWGGKGREAFQVLINVKTGEATRVP